MAEKSLYATESEAVIAMETAQRERKNAIIEEMKKLESAFEQAKTRADEATKYADSIDVRIAKLEEEAKDLEKVVIDGSRETIEFINKCRAILTDCEAKSQKMIDIVLSIEKTGEKATDTLMTTKAEIKTLHEANVKEGELMDRQRNDLDIYHDRLVAYFEKYLPDQKVII